MSVTTGFRLFPLSATTGQPHPFEALKSRVRLRGSPKVGADVAKGKEVHGSRRIFRGTCTAGNKHNAAELLLQDTEITQHCRMDESKRSYNSGASETGVHIDVARPQQQLAGSILPMTLIIKNPTVDVPNTT